MVLVKLKLGKPKVMMEDKISIVILCYNGYDLTHQLLSDVKQHCSQVHEVIVVDNASEDPSVARGLEFWLGMQILPLKVVNLRHNRGFIGGMNYGLSKATGDIVVLLSNDVRITGNTFWGDLVGVFREDKKSLVGGIVYQHDTGWNTFKNQIFPYVEGWFLAATKEFWGQVGGFDEQFAPSDFEDIDLSTQALQMGYSLRTIDGIKHLGAKTYGYNSERLARTIQNKSLFATKWGVEA